MEKRKVCIEQLLSDLKSLEVRVETAKNEDSLPFLFFSESFEQTASIQRLLQEWEQSQAEALQCRNEELQRQIEVLQRQVSDLQHAETLQRQSESRQQQTEMSQGAEMPQRQEETLQGDLPLPRSETQQQSFETRQRQAEELQRQSAEPQNPSQQNTPSVAAMVFPEYRNPKGFVVPPPVTDTNTAPVFTKREEEHPVVRSLNDAIQAPPALQDLRRSISLNDRFLFQRELFHNDREEMNRVMGVLNSFQSYREAENYLRNNCAWNFDDAIVEEFLWAIEKGFQE